MSALRALVVLLLRHWARASLPSHVRRDRGRRVSAAVFRLAYFGTMSAWGYAVGHLVTKLEPAARERGTAFVVLGVVGLAVVWSALTRGPTLRGESSPLETSFLDTLPIPTWTRLVVGLLERLFVHAFGGAALVSVAPASPGRALAVALTLATAGVFVGDASMRLARVVLPALALARVRAYALVLGQLVFLMCVVQAPALGKSARLAPVVSGWPTTVARALLPDGRLGLVLGLGVVAIVLALAAIELAERIGWDRVDLVPPGRIRRAKRTALDTSHVDDVLRGREPGSRWSTLVMAGYSLLVTLAIVGFAWNARHAGAEAAGTMTRGVVGLAGFGAFVVVTARAARMALRDMTARPLLAPLPLVPRDLLAGKVARLRRDAVLVVAPVALLLATPWPRAMHVEIGWRIGTLLVAVVLAAEAAAAIAFLTVGAGSKKGPGGGFAIESVLVLAPLVGVTTAPSPTGTLVPLVALAFVAREARRSGLRCVRWLDDADDFERETPTWRALLVLAAFQATGVLAERVAVASDLSTSATVLVRELASAFVLGGLTWQARRDAPVLRFGAAPRWLLAGLAVGLGTAAPFLGRAIHPVNATLVPMLVLAIVEQTFFRGWLQPCLEEELPAAIARPAAAVASAFAFAALGEGHVLAHFLIGLGAGVLFTKSRGIAPSIVAHVTHTILVVLFGTG